MHRDIFRIITNLLMLRPFFFPLALLSPFRVDLQLVGVLALIFITPQYGIRGVKRIFWDGVCWRRALFYLSVLPISNFVLLAGLYDCEHRGPAYPLYQRNDAYMHPHHSDHANSIENK